MKRFLLSLIALVCLCAPASAISCNPADSWIKSKGTYVTGNIVVFGPDCETISDAGALPPLGVFKVISGTYPISVADCGSTLLLGGNTQYLVTLGAAAGFGACKISIQNTDTYTGPGSGRGKQLNINGIGQFILYPQNSLTLQGDTANWRPDRPINTTYGQVWAAQNAVTFFVDNTAPDLLSDGLAAGAANAFKSNTQCATSAYSIVYSRNFGGVTCNVANESFQEQLNIFYPIPGGGVLAFTSPSFFTWKPINSGFALQLGDGALVTLTNVVFDAGGVVAPQGYIFGHNFGVLDTFTQVIFNTTGTIPFIACDFNTQFNINNGLTIVNTGASAATLFNGCSGSTWNWNGPVGFNTNPTFGKFMDMKSGSRWTFQGTYAISGAFTATLVSTLSGNSVIANFSGTAVPGGAPTATTGAQYCAAGC